mmetsp:Transcript_1629/g.3374  ORF Transcript_1629/g.3374 Transcript_1629/m.3374 type:complete len:196 (-) Transcript_1629:1091-1678(-)
MGQVEMAQTAYAKVVLHALKHPSASVNGVLIGKPGSSGLVVTDAVGMMHGQLALAPMIEVALAQIEAHFTDQGLSIVGYYHANERLRDQEMASVGKKVADKIASRCPEAVALLVDCQKLDKLLDPDPPCVLKLYTRIGGKWKAEETEPSNLKFKEAGTTNLVADFIQEERFKRVYDFLDHVEDMTCDWLNPTLMD